MAMTFDNSAPTPTPLTAALSYAARGWPVSLCTRSGYRSAPAATARAGAPASTPAPRTASRTRRRTSRRFARGGVAGRTPVWRSPPAALSRSSTWTPSKGGDDSLVDSRRVLGDLPDTVEVITGSGGRHIYLSVPEGATVRCSAGQLGPGLDVRGEGGYVVAPPSLHVSGRRYVWEASSDPADIAVAPMPEGWLSRLTSRPRSLARAAQPLPRRSPRGSARALLHGAQPPG
ncbi:MAG: bifunctional DNA primase/polymerase [Polyangiales bacterium]